MRWLRLVRGELRKLTTTKLLWGFLAVLVIISATNATAVIFGTDMDGSKTFVSTADDQASLMAFGFNALLGTTLFGAIAASREYGHNTVVPMYLTAPRRYLAVLAQFVAVVLAGGLLGLIGEGLTVLAVAAALPTTDYAFLVSAGAVAQLMVASLLAGAVGGLLGAGIGLALRHMGGAVTAAVLLLFVLPGIVVQLVNETASWVPSTLLRVISGVATDTGLFAALVALVAWGLVPAAIGLLAVERRDVV